MPAWERARVTTMRFPASGAAPFRPALSFGIFITRPQNVACAILQQTFRQFAPERGGVTLFSAEFAAVKSAAVRLRDDSFEPDFFAFQISPRSNRHMATTA